jgi:general secretion pathway protein A
MSSGYEWFGLFERPFSLTPDARYHYRSRSHARALGGLSTGLDRRVPLLLLTGDLGTGKSTLCRTLAHSRGHDGPVVYFANALVGPDELYWRLVFDLAHPAADASRQGLTEGSAEDLARRAAQVLAGRTGAPALVIVDEAHLLPPATADALLGLAALDPEGRSAVQIVLASQPPSYGAPTLSRRIDESVLHRARLTPLDRDECEPYVIHRLHVAGGAPLAFSPSAVDVLYTLSGGVPRLVNLLCERALQEAAALGVRRFEPEMFETAAAALELQRLRARRHRWSPRRPDRPRVPQT